jgi:ribosome-associated toxin RatA of RatAB toxin-antitoxin module
MRTSHCVDGPFTRVHSCWEYSLVQSTLTKVLLQVKNAEDRISALVADIHHDLLRLLYAVPVFRA